MTARRRNWSAAVILGLAGVANPGPASWAHDLDQVQQDMFERDQYFQIKDQPVPDFALQDSQGVPVSRSDFLGNVVVLNFIYASCTDFCPLHSEKIAEIQQLIGISPMRDLFQFVSVTTDPLRDTPAVLESYGPLHGLDRSNWVFLTIAEGMSADATREIARSYGIEFTPQDDGMLMHGVATIVIDKEGQWRGTFHGLDFPAVDLVLFANALLNSDHAHDDGGVSWIQGVVGAGFLAAAGSAFLVARRRIKSSRQLEA